MARTHNLATSQSNSGIAVTFSILVSLLVGVSLAFASYQASETTRNLNRVATSLANHCQLPGHPIVYTKVQNLENCITELRNELRELNVVLRETLIRDSDDKAQKKE